MSRRARWIVRIAVGLMALFVIAVVAAVLLMDTILRHVMIARVEDATGMKTTIGEVHVGLRSGAMTIKDFRLYNGADFGSAVCLDMPELQVVCDPASLTDHILRIKLLRLDLSRISVVEGKNGRSNFSALEQKAGHENIQHQASSSGLKFAGIDTLDLSIGTLQVRNLASGRDTEVPFNIRHQMLHHVKSEADLAVLGVILALHGGSSKSGSDLQLLLNALK